MPKLSGAVAGLLFLVWATTGAAPGQPTGGLIPPGGQIKRDRPRMLLRPAATPLAITLAQLKAIPRDAEFAAMLEKLRAGQAASALAMAYLLTGDKASADRAVQQMLTFKMPDQPNSFDVYLRLRELALAYDWLHDYEGFGPEARAQARAKINPLAAHGAAGSNDHVFHNYVWMNCGGAMLWALATAGEDPEADRIFAALRDRLNAGMYRGMAYLSGQAGESPGYWTLYDLFPCALTVLAAQSAFETDVVGRIRREQGDWLGRQLDNVIHSSLPNLRYVTWGDIQSGGDGGVAHEVAGVACGLSWAMGSGAGAFFDRWVGQRRGLARFYGADAIFYFLYSRQLKVAPAEPPLSFLAGSPTGGTVVARGGWGDGDTVVSFRCTDYFGNHNHNDQGSFRIYRNGHLACDPDLYKKVAGPQQPSDMHNTLLIDGQRQRRLTAQHFRTVDDFTANLMAGARLETGGILFYRDGLAPLHLNETKQDPSVKASYATVAGQFAQAYPAGLVQSCIRQVTFIRPDKVVVIDWLTAPPGKTIGQVEWVLMLPAEPKVADDGVLTVSNGKSWLRCWGGGQPKVEPALDKWQRARYAYPWREGRERLVLVHVLQVGDGEPPAASPKLDDDRISLDDGQVELRRWEKDRMWVFFGPSPDFGEKPAGTEVPKPFEVWYCLKTPERQDR